MKRISLVPLVIPPKDDKVIDRVAGYNLKTYDRRYYRVEQDKWIREIKKIFFKN